MIKVKLEMILPLLVIIVGLACIATGLFLYYELSSSDVGVLVDCFDRYDHKIISLECEDTLYAQYGLYDSSLLIAYLGAVLVFLGFMIGTALSLFGGVDAD